MATNPLQARIADALSRIPYPRTGDNLVASQAVRDVATTTSGKVRLTLLLAQGDDPALARTVRQALENVEGVSEVTVDVADAAQFAPNRKPASRALPVMDQPPAQQRVPAPTPKQYPNLGKVIAVSSGKGGVGKSTVSVNLAVALAQSGARVGLMDADIYGPNIPTMMGLSEPPMVINERIVPLEAHGVKVMSLGVLIDRDQPAIWRGPIIMKIITQFLGDVAWGQLDYFIVDLPPGTGDAQLTLVQSTEVSGAVIVTTPQEVSVGDALRGAKMFERVDVPVLGIVENMSWFECPHCGKPSPIFGSGGGERLARELELPLLGQIPLYPPVMQGGDTGAPIVVTDPQSSAARALVAMTERVAERAGAAVTR
ncbi:MAG TPA: Mrp/NBP35 family ATP-binding protein [Gemmatimonadaceae bacterium]|nr:Mrp/NBP35 family ATP-binding protein [Gemmatimonadaceae bacterium]